MFKQAMLAISLTLISVASSAEFSPFVSANVGIAANDDNTDVAYDAGIGLEISKYVQLEARYRAFGNLGLLDEDLDSASAGVNLLWPMTPSIRVFATVGYETFDSDEDDAVREFLEEQGQEDVEFSIEERDDSAYLGLGVLLNGPDKWDVRVQVLSHDGNEVSSASVGFNYYLF
jgi:hypothetical protein